MALVLLCVISNNALADAYLDARAELIAAYQAGNFTAMETAANNALDARPGYPGALFNLAFAKSLGGNSAAALDILRGLVASGVDFGVADIEEFTALQELPGWQDYANAVATLNEPFGKATVAFRYDVSDFVPEGIADIDGDLLLGSIRHGSIVRLGKSTSTISTPQVSGHWSVFGMRPGPQGGLWFVSAAVPEYAGVDGESAGSTGLFRLDLASGKITASAVLPESAAAMVLGDLEFTDDNTIYATESLTGALYRYTVSSGEMAQVVAPGALRSMQGLAVDDSGDYLYVSDYVGGLFRIQLSDYSIKRMTATEPVTLFGIDGLYRHGNELIAIQNGIRPNRVIAFRLSSDGDSITGSRILARKLPEFDEPTLGTVAGDEFLFVANSHWNRFDRGGNLPPDLAGPIVLRIKL